MEHTGHIINFRRNMHRPTGNHVVVKVEGFDTKDKAKTLVGKTVTYNTGKKEMQGKISAAHGNSGAVRVIFPTGMPGQCLGKKVKLS